VRRVAAAIGVATLTLILTAPPAAAHTVTGVKPSNFNSRILGIRPAAPDLFVRLLDLGRRIELRNRGRHDVIVLGYDNEPYLRVGPSGAFENRRSRSRYVNRLPSVGAQTNLPATTDTNATPSWRRVRTDPVVRWRDQRTRYEARPPAGGAQVLGTWNIALVRGDASMTVTGILTYVPGPSPWVWAATVVALVALTAAAAFRTRWGRWLSLALALLLASDAIHSFGTAAATHESFAAQLVKVLLAGLVTTMAWIIGVVSIPSLQRNHEGGLVAAGGVGMVVAAFGGVTDVGVFANSQVASVFPAVTARIAVALALGLGVGLVIAAVIVIARDPRLRPTTTGTPVRPLR